MGINKYSLFIEVPMNIREYNEDMEERLYPNMRLSAGEAEVVKEMKTM